MNLFDCRYSDQDGRRHEDHDGRERQQHSQDRKGDEDRSEEGLARSGVQHHHQGQRARRKHANLHQKYFAKR